METFKARGDFQELLEPTFMQGFKLAVGKAAQCYPTLKFEDLDPLVDEVPIPLTDALFKAREKTPTEAGGKEAGTGATTQMIDVNVQAPQKLEEPSVGGVEQTLL